MSQGPKLIQLNLGKRYFENYFINLSVWVASKLPNVTRLLSLKSLYIVTNLKILKQWQICIYYALKTCSVVLFKVTLLIIFSKTYSDSSFQILQKALQFKLYAAMKRSRSGECYRWCHFSENFAYSLRPAMSFISFHSLVLFLYSRWIIRSNAIGSSILKLSRFLEERTCFMELIFHWLSSQNHSTTRKKFF